MGSKTKPGGLAEYVSRLVERSPKRQREIATEIGYSNPNLISMFKAGTIKIPLEIVPKLAAALGEDPAFLLRLALKEYAPDVLDAIERHMGRIITEDEHHILQAVRSVTRKPRATPELLEAIKQAARDLKQG